MKKRKTDIRLSHLTFTLILEEMLSGPCTAKAISEHSGMTHRVVLRLMRTMHAKKVCHIAGWESGYQRVAFGVTKTCRIPLGVTIEDLQRIGVLPTSNEVGSCE